VHGRRYQVNLAHKIARDLPGTGAKDNMYTPLRARTVTIQVVVLALVAIPTGDAVGGTATKAVLSGNKVRVEAELADGRLRERYLARANDGAWVEVATSDGVNGGPICLYRVRNGPQDNTPQEIPVTATGVSASATEMTETLLAGPCRIARRVSFDGDGPWLRVTTRLEPSEAVELQSVTDRFAFAQHSEWSFSPSVGGFNPDAQYKAPLILVQSRQVALGVVPDVTALGRDTLRLCHHALDLDVTADPSLRVGFIPAKLARHSVYSVDAERAWKLERPLENVYFLLVTATAEPGQAYRQCVRFHWERFGRPSQSFAAEQQKGTGPYQDLALLDQWRQRVWDEESRKAWLRIVLPDGSIGGGVSTSRALGPRSVYLSSWFNSLRTSFGMALYARRTRNDGLLQLAAQTVELALKSPGANGAFKCIAALDKDNQPVWGAGDGSGGSTIQGYLGYDMSWTAYWLLRWKEAQLPGHERILPRCQGLARFLIAHQQPDGMFATFFDEAAGNPLKDKAPYTIAETGPVALFLLKLYEVDKQREYLDAATKGLVFLEKNVIPQRKWYDFETFWSCSPRGISFDTRTGQWPANDLALGQTAAAFLQAWRVTGDRAYLAKGESLLDYLLLYQQCWTNPLLEGLTGPTMLLGGFTTQNSDAEWSDARQSQCGNILLDYYRATGKAEYLERGVAALRAQFPISPSENWAHGGYGGKAGVSSFHWGSGSGMAGIEIDEGFLRDAIVDVASGAGVGVNGLNVTKCEIGNGRIAIEIDSPFPWPREPVVTFRNVGSSARYALVVNGIMLGVYQSAELEKGIGVSLKDVLSPAGVLPAYSTTFDGDEDPLSEGGKWINNGLDWTQIGKQGGIAHGTQTGTNQGIHRYDDSYAHLSGFPPDQEAWAQVQITKPDPSCHQELEILLRWTSSAHNTTGYECFARCLKGDSSYLQIVRWEGPLGEFTYLADKRGADYGLKDGDTLRASIVGSVITVYINGIEKAQVEDGTYKTGDPGIGAFLLCDDGRGIGSNTDFGFRSFTARGIGGNQPQRRN
jgi:hypothetical protein